MMTLLLQALYLMLPAYAANMAPVIVRRWFSFLALPLDFGVRLGGKPILGANKTLRGLVFGIIFAVIVAFIQNVLGGAGGLAVIDYGEWFWIGILMGAGAIVGDAVESFVKRRLGLRPGAPFVPFDQTDFCIGALLFIYPWYPVGMPLVVAAIAGSAVLHIIVNHAAFYLGIRKEKW